MNKINSRENAFVKNIIRLSKSSKERRKQGVFVAEGLRLCQDALKSDCFFEFICFSGSFVEKHGDLCSAFKERCGSLFVLSDALFHSICDTQTPQGILCGVKMLDKTVDSDKIRLSGKIIALDNLQDPGNMGAILRTADAFGIDAVIVNRGCCDIYCPKVVRGSMGAIFRQNIISIPDLPAFLISYNKLGNSFAAVLSDTSVSVGASVFPDNSLAVIGNEGGGVSKEVIQACTEKIIIPMSGKAESLNAAVAAGIIMWEMVK